MRAKTPTLLSRVIRAVNAAELVFVGGGQRGVVVHHGVRGL